MILYHVTDQAGDVTPKNSTAALTSLDSTAALVSTTILISLDSTTALTSTGSTTDLTNIAFASTLTSYYMPVRKSNSTPAITNDFVTSVTTTSTNDYLQIYHNHVWKHQLFMPTVTSRSFAHSLTLLQEGTI